MNCGKGNEEPAAGKKEEFRNDETLKDVHGAVGTNQTGGISVSLIK